MNINNPAHLKITLLVEGLDIDNKIKKDLGTFYQEKIYSYSLTDWTTEKVLLPSDIKLDHRAYVGFRFNPKSKWKLIKEKENFYVSYQNERKIPVELIPRPKYYDKKISSGKKVQEIGVSCGNHGVSFFINSFCEYFLNNENCKFCGLVPTQRRFSDTVKRKTPEQVYEATRIILDSGEQVDFVQLSGGSCYDHDKEVKRYIPFVSKIHEQLNKRRLVDDIPIHLTSMPPKNFNLLEELKDCGLKTISFDLECPSQQYFEKYCPGKAKSYGYKEMRNALKQALNVFGEGNVYSIVILGIEPRESFVNNLEDIINDGIIPTLNTVSYTHLTLPTN